ncbi:MAG TPA: hypothetical protein VHO25_02510 [Polyangiaceae bacterium]|nr:hypothetical protein [Polyangiaceae bacterium]
MSTGRGREPGQSGQLVQGQLAIVGVPDADDLMEIPEGKTAARELTSARVAKPSRRIGEKNVSVLTPSRVEGARGEGARDALALELRVTDPEVIAELQRMPEGEAREQYALSALRLGVLSLRMASGQVDAGSIREAGQKLVMEIDGMLGARATQLTGDVTSELRQYFDPSNGAFNQRIKALVEKDGQLESVLRSHLGPDDSVLARTLAAHLGEGSAVFKMLSPSEADGLLQQLAGTLEGALKDQRERLLSEFSLNNKESALSRLVGEIAAGHGQLKTDLKGQMDVLVKEFSLNNDESALSRLSRLLQSTSDQIGSNLTLDDDKSPLSRLKRELEATVADLAQKNLSFHGEVRETLAKLQATKQEAARSTRHGLTFEAQLGSFLNGEAQRLGDVSEAVGTTTGLIKNRKFGDYCVSLGPDSSAPGARMVWEAKEEAGYDLRAALLEIEQARKNRDAQLGIFVFSKKTAPEGLLPFSRYGDDLVVVWDAEEPSTDLYLSAAYSVARALAVRVGKQDGQSQEAVLQIQMATRALEKQLQYLDDLHTWGQTVQNNGTKIADRAERMKNDVLKEIERLDTQVELLKSAQD